jgi:protein-S-isoprenylcysteine O-methyltransferase Ste14
VCETADMKTWPTWLSILVAVVVIIGILVYGNRSATWTAHQIIGMAIAIPALCLWALARVQLRRSFAISAQAKELVTLGLYSKIQNPVYAFGAILIAGVIVYFGQPRLFLLFLILIPVQWMRIRNERRALEGKFGEAYREYRRRTWF